MAGPAALLLSGCRYAGRAPTMALPPAPRAIIVPSLVKVVVARSEGELSVACPGGGSWYADAEGEQTLIATGSGPWLTDCEDGRLTLDKDRQAATVIELYCADDVFKLGRRTYRGRLRIRAGAQGGIIATNIVPPADYLCSVVGSELYANWPLDTLMAQAVAARTFMLYSLAAKGYMSAADMAYRGVEAECRSADLAVTLTDGIILTYDERILPAYFQSTCGGHTAPADKAFAQEPIGPLQGVACQWCGRSPTHRWKARIAGYRIRRALRERGLGLESVVARVVGISPVGTEPDGYARFVDVVWSPGADGPIRLGANAFRRAVGTRLLRSVSFTVSEDGGTFVFEGRGHGHGVGMCQWGAHGLAQAGGTWRDILNHYYPGAAIQTTR